MNHLLVDINGPQSQINNRKYQIAVLGMRSKEWYVDDKIYSDKKQANAAITKAINQWKKSNLNEQASAHYSDHYNWKLVPVTEQAI